MECRNEEVSVSKVSGDTDSWNWGLGGAKDKYEERNKNVLAI